MELDRQALDNYITGHYGEDQFSSDTDEDAPEEESRPMTPEAAIQQAIWELMRDTQDWSERDDPHGVIPWLKDRTAALRQAQTDLAAYRKMKAAIGVLVSLSTD